MICFIVHNDDISFLSLKVEIFLHRPLTSASKAPKAQNYCAITFYRLVLFTRATVCFLVCRVQV